MPLDQNVSVHNIQLKVDAMDAFDYAKPVNAKYKLKDIKNMLEDEISQIQANLFKF